MMYFKHEKADACEWGLEHDNIRIEWVRLGEGYGGDYNPDDPEDEELLRFDLTVRDEDGEWPLEANESRCTLFPVNSDEVYLKGGLRWMLNRFLSREARHPMAGLRNAADLMSYVTPNEVRILLEQEKAAEKGESI